MASRHSRMPSDVDRDTFTGHLNRATPIMPQLGMPPMTKEAKESRDQAQQWDASLNRIFQTMQGEDTARYLTYFKTRLEIEETYARSLEKLAMPSKGNKATGSSGNSTHSGVSTHSGGGGLGGPGNHPTGQVDPEEIPTTLHMAFDAILETTQHAAQRRRSFLKLLKTLTGALAGLKESHEKQRKAQKEVAKPVFQLYAETRLSTVPKLKRTYEQRCRDVEQALAIEDSDYLPVRERLKNLASTAGAAGRLAKSKRDMEEADADYKTAVQSLETFRQQRERCYDNSYLAMQNMIMERGSKCRQCLEAYVMAERELIAGATSDIDRFSVVVDCIKPTNDVDLLSVSFTKSIQSHPKAVQYENYYNKIVPETIFGMSLSDYVRKYKHPIPLVIVQCADAIDRSGLKREGIYRVSGRHAQIMNLKKMFEVNEESVDLAESAIGEDVASVAAVLKIYLRELPEPLFPFPLNERSAYSANPDTNVRLNELKGRLKRLEDCNIDTLQFLIQHLRRIYENVEDNKMTLENISMIFTPAIFHDFNSAMVAGPQGAGPQQAQLNIQPTPVQPQQQQQQQQQIDPNATPSGQYPQPASGPLPGSPGSTSSSWSSYPNQPAETMYQPQTQYQPQSQQKNTYNQSLGLVENSSGTATTAPMAIPDHSNAALSSATGLSPYPHGSSPHAGSNLSSSSTSPTASSFAPMMATVSTPASWTNDLVLADLILNSHTIFDVLPKLPSRTNSVMVADERMLLAGSLAQASLRGEQQHASHPHQHQQQQHYSQAHHSQHQYPHPGPRPFSNLRKSSSSSLGSNGPPPQPTSPIEGGHLRRPEPRFDSLGPKSATRPPLPGQAVSDMGGSTSSGQLSPLSISSAGGYSQSYQNARSNTPPSPSSMKGHGMVHASNPPPLPPLGGSGGAGGVTGGAGGSGGGLGARTRSNIVERAPRSNPSHPVMDESSDLL